MKRNKSHQTLVIALGTQRIQKKFNQKPVKKPRKAIKLKRKQRNTSNPVVPPRLSLTAVQAPCPSLIQTTYIWEHHFKKSVVTVKEVPGPTKQLVATLPQSQQALQDLRSCLDVHNAEFWAFVDSFLKEQNSPHTRRAYENDLVDFLGYLKATQKPMNVHTLVEYRSILEKRLSSRTQKPLTHVSINRRLATIKSFLNWLVLNGVISNNPAKAIKSFRAGRESPTRDIPDDLVARMLMLPNRHRTAGRMHQAILMILFYMGLRRAEVVGLRTSDVFEQAGMRVLRVRGKGDKERILPIPDAVFKTIEIYLLMAHKKLDRDQPLFSPVKNNVTKEFNKHLNPNTIAYILTHYAQLAGVTYRVSPHSARATAVSNALDHQATHRAVQHMAGWSSPLMVSRYDKRKADLKNSAVRLVKY